MGSARAAMVFGLGQKRQAKLADLRDATMRHQARQASSKIETLDDAVRDTLGGN